MIMFEKRPPELGSNDIRCLCELNGWLKFIPVKGRPITVWHIYSVANLFHTKCNYYVLTYLLTYLLEAIIVPLPNQPPTKQYLRSVGYSFRFQLLFQSNLQCSGGVYN